MNESPTQGAHLVIGGPLNGTHLSAHVAQTSPVWLRYGNPDALTPHGKFQLDVPYVFVASQNVWVYADDEVHLYFDEPDASWFGLRATGDIIGVVPIATDLARGYPLDELIRVEVAEILDREFEKLRSG